MEEEGVMNFYVDNQGLMEKVVAGLMNEVYDDGSKAFERVEKGAIMTFTMTT